MTEPIKILALLVRKLRYQFVQDAQIEGQLQRMRVDIEQFGESILSNKEVIALCQFDVAGERQWSLIAKIAINEGWSFTFYPDGRVRFAKL